MVLVDEYDFDGILAMRHAWTNDGSAGAGMHGLMEEERQVHACDGMPLGGDVGP